MTVKRIESRNNQILKDTVALRERNVRGERGRFFFEGVHLLEEFLRSGRQPVRVFVRESSAERLGGLISALSCEIVFVTDPVFEKLSTERAPQGVVTVAEFTGNVRVLGRDPLEAKGCRLLLDGLQDNGNVGTVIRTAAALDYGVIAAGCADVFSQKTVRASMGAAFFADISVCRDTVSAAEKVKSSGGRVIAASVYGECRELGGFELRPGDCFVIGSEGRGVSKEALDVCDFSARIPMGGRVESLNAAAAAAMFLWEAKRQGL